MQANGLSGTYWAGGPWWGNYRLSSEMRSLHDEAPQMPIMAAYADGPGTGHWPAFSWYRDSVTSGTTIATLDGTNNSDNAIKISSPGNIVHPIPYNRGYMNTTTQTVDHLGRAHVIAWRLPEEGTPANPVNLNDWRYYHYWRDTDGTWTEIRLPFHGRKPQLVLDQVGNIHVFYGHGTDLNYHTSDPGTTLTRASATEASGWSDWVITTDITGRTYHGELLLDMDRWYAEGILSLYYQEKPGSAGWGSPLRVLDFTPVPPSPLQPTEGYFIKLRIDRSTD